MRPVSSCVLASSLCLGGGGGGCNGAGGGGAAQAATASASVSASNERTILAISLPLQCNPIPPARKSAAACGAIVSVLGRGAGLQPLGARRMRQLRPAGDAMGASGNFSDQPVTKSLLLPIPFPLLLDAAEGAKPLKAA